MQTQKVASADWDPDFKLTSSSPINQVHVDVGLQILQLYTKTTRAVSTFLGHSTQFYSRKLVTNEAMKFIPRKPHWLPYGKQFSTSKRENPGHLGWKGDFTIINKLTTGGLEKPQAT